MRRKLAMIAVLAVSLVAGACSDITAPSEGCQVVQGSETRC